MPRDLLPPFHKIFARTEPCVQRTLLFGPYFLRTKFFVGHGGGGYPGPCPTINCLKQTGRRQQGPAMVCSSPGATVKCALVTCLPLIWCQNCCLSASFTQHPPPPPFPAMDQLHQCRLTRDDNLKGQIIYCASVCGCSTCFQTVPRRPTVFSRALSGPARLGSLVDPNLTQVYIMPY